MAFRWWRDSSHRDSAPLTPAVTVSGAFTTGGNYTGQASDLQNNLELHDYASFTHGTHYMRFGGLLRSYNDAYTTHANINGSYQFQSIAQYEAGKPSLYSAAVIHNPLVKVLAVDAALFFQDEWRWSAEREYQRGSSRRRPELNPAVIPPTGLRVLRLCGVSITMARRRRRLLFVSASDFSTTVSATTTY